VAAITIARFFPALREFFASLNISDYNLTEAIMQRNGKRPSAMQMALYSFTLTKMALPFILLDYLFNKRKPLQDPINETFVSKSTHLRRL
jgi:hypothetical protein